MKIAIVGAGMAGLLAAAMLRDEAMAIMEAQHSLPNNHTALLRFRSSVVGDVLNIPFKKVKVMKAVDSAGMNPVAAMLAYSIKSNGTATMRSSISANGEIEERYIAPSNLVELMASKVNCPINFGKSFAKPTDWRPDRERLPYISTMPMPLLMDILGWEDKPEFMHVGGYNITAVLPNVDAYCTLYIPDKLRQENRISITGNKLTIEVALPALKQDQIDYIIKLQSFEEAKAKLGIALRTLGLFDQCSYYEDVQVHPQRYAKILPIDESIRRNFIIWASEQFGVYSLGRFATWRPGLLLDDVVNDVRVVQRLINGHSSYDHIKRD